MRQMANRFIVLYYFHSVFVHGVAKLSFSNTIILFAFPFEIRLQEIYIFSFFYDIKDIKLF